MEAQDQDGTLVILHGAWYDGALHVWGETKAVENEARIARRRAAGRRGAPAAGVRWSPYDADPEWLEAVLPPAEDGEGQGKSAGTAQPRRRKRARVPATRTLVAWLPSVGGSPIASSPLIADPPADLSRTAIAPWRVSTRTLSLGQALELLAACANTRTLAPGIIVGSDLSFFAELLRYAAALVAREQFLPTLRSTDRFATPPDAGGPEWEARWIPVVAGDDARRLHELAERMPAACRALAEDEKEAPEPSPDAVARAFLEVVVDGLARRTANRGSERAPAQRRAVGRAFDSLHHAWLHALQAADARVHGDPGGLARLADTIRDWQQPVVAAETAPLRLAFRLEEPEPQAEEEAGQLGPRHGSAPAESADDDDADRWTVRYLLQSVTDPSLFVPAADAWKGGRHASTVLGRGFDARAHLLRSLGQAASLDPGVDASLSEAQPAAFETDTDGAFAFLAERAWTLEQAGFGVILPAWWTRRGARSRLSLRARVKSPSQSSGMLSLASLLQVDWSAALGDQPLTRAELEALARFKTPLVRLRGQWVQVTAEDRQRALDLLKKDRSTRMTAGELVRLALGAAAQDKAPGGLQVTGIDATGWFDDVLRRLQGREPITELDQPGGLVGVLRPYQARGYSWLSFLGSWGLGACLVDDMGLGKTVQALALMQRDWDAGVRKPVLLICPMSVVSNWQKEAERFTPRLPVLVHHGHARAKDDSFRTLASTQALVISSYSLLHRDLEWLSTVDWRGIVLDEAQNIKNAETKQARAARSLGADYRVALTGTPVENSVSDLWSIMEFLNPGFLGSRAGFRDSFLLPIQTGSDPQAAERLKRLTGPFVLRRMKTDRAVISDLPDKQEMKLFCTLTREQASLYRAVVAEAERELRKTEGIKRKGVVLATLSRLKQVCNHPAQFLGDRSPLPGRSGKLARLTEMLEEVAAEGERALVFTQFAEMGALLERHLEATFGRDVLFLHGGVAKAQRDRMVERFQSGDDEAFVFVLSLKAGGTGLNLTAANHVFMFDRWWNPAVENQAIDRAFRIGQTRRVQVHKFLCAGTLEERIDQMLERKQEVASRVVGTGEAWLTELTTEQLREIFALRAEAIGE
ncbi:MAG: DEAD/DEAH box helicase [Bacteroidales bacterium]